MSNNHGKVEKLESKIADLTWININYPNEKSVSYLKRKYKFHHLDLEDCLSENQRAKIDEYDNYLFLIFHVPILSSKTGRIEIGELNVFIGKNFVITLHEDMPTLQKLFNKCKHIQNNKLRDQCIGKGSGYLLYKILNELFDACFPMIDIMSTQIEFLENDVFDQSSNRDRLKDILLLKKDIINFRRIILPQRAIIAQLEHKDINFVPDDLNVYFDDVVDKIEKIWSNLENLKELVASLHETNESILSNSTNNVIKALTIFSVIMLPLNFVTGFYGMNLIDLPFASHPLSIFIVSSLIFVLAMIMVAVFRYKKWL